VPGSPGWPVRGCLVSAALRPGLSRLGRTVARLHRRTAARPHGQHRGSASNSGPSRRLAASA